MEANVSPRCSSGLKSGSASRETTLITPPAVRTTYWPNVTNWFHSEQVGDLRPLRLRQLPVRVGADRCVRVDQLMQHAHPSLEQPQRGIGGAEAFQFFGFEGRSFAEHPGDDPRFERVVSDGVQGRVFVVIHGFFVWSLVS